MSSLPVRALPSLIVYIGAAIFSYLAIGFVHVLSDRGIYGILTESYQVRQFSIYLLNVLPIYLITVYVVSTAYFYFKTKSLHGYGQLPLGIWVIINIISGFLTVIIHLPLFPTSLRAMLFLQLMTVLFAVGFPTLSAILFGYLPKLRALIFPQVRSVGLSVFVGVVLSVAYVVIFRTALFFDVIKEEETYNPRLELSANWFNYKPSKEIISGKRGSHHPYLQTPPDVSLFTREALSISGDMNKTPVVPQGLTKQNQNITDQSLKDRNLSDRNLRFIDLDKNGFYDIVAKTKSKKIEAWLNYEGVFEKSPNFFMGLQNENIADFYFADADGDGLQDLLVSQIRLPLTSSFENSFLKSIYWYPTFAAYSIGRLFRQNQTKKDSWEEVSDTVFPEGLPWAYRKMEPVLWFDANSDGRLDFAWQQYPHPRQSLNQLYVQAPNGTFENKFGDLVYGTSKHVFAEGSDVADLDNDGDLDIFGYGFLYKNQNGKFYQVCGSDMPGFFCDAVARNDEGGTFEDFDGDGKLDLVVSHHGTGAEIPKYYLQFLASGDEKGGNLNRKKKFERQFYGMHVYLRAKDFDFNGVQDLLTVAPGRLLTMYDGNWLDLMPSITNIQTGVNPLGWIDVDEDGDWDIVVNEAGTDEIVLLKNKFDPERYIKFSLLGNNGIENQAGATLRIQLPNGRDLVHVHRLTGGYAGTVDPRLIFLPEPNREYDMEACFASLLSLPVSPSLESGIKLSIYPGNKPNCVNYKLKISDHVERVDLSLIAGAEGARAVIRKRKIDTK